MRKKRLRKDRPRKRPKKAKKPKPEVVNQHPYGAPVGTRDDPQAVYDPRCYGE